MELNSKFKLNIGYNVIPKHMVSVFKSLKVQHTAVN